MAELKEQSNFLWQSFVSGNESAFRSLYDHTYSSLYRNRLIDLKRKDKRRDVPVIEPVESPESEWLAQENEEYRNQWLRQQLDELPERQREAIHLRYRVDLDYPEIAKRLGVSIQVVYNYVNRGIKTIRGRTNDLPDEFWVLLISLPLLLV